MILSPGLESAKEEFYHWENVFLKRQLATLSLEGPGQGETCRLMPMRHDYEAVAGATLDFLEGRDDVDAGRVGIAGVSLGVTSRRGPQPLSTASKRRWESPARIAGPSLCSSAAP